MELFWIIVFIIAVVVLVRSSKAKKRRKQALHAAKTQELVNDLEGAKDMITVNFTFSSSDGYNGSRPTQEAARAESETCWIEPGKSVTIGSYTIPDGMVYVGEKLRSLSRGGQDAALIDPKKSVNTKLVDRAGSTMNYWPSYSEISASSRAAYLEWLAGGRRDPEAYIGYVFLFLYGLERRLLEDARQSDVAKAEIPRLLKEVQDLLDVYGDKSGSFKSYASDLIEAVTLSQSSEDYTQLKPPESKSGWDYPLTFKVAVGAMVMQGMSIPAEWALAWVRLYPEARFRTPAERCAGEFDRLFKVRYSEKFPDGLRVKPNKSRVRASYRPSSPSLGEVKLDIPELPDVSVLDGPINQLMQIAEAVQDELDAYSRAIGQGNGPGSIPALAQLPSELHDGATGEEAKSLVEIVEKGLADNSIKVLATSDLIGLYPAQTAGRLTKKEATLLAQFMGKRGFGIEPDTRHGAPNISRSKRYTVYRLDGPDESPGESFNAATVLLLLGVAMANADGDVTVDEQKHLEAHIRQALQLNESEKKRLSAHMQWLLADPPTLAGAKSRIEVLDESQRHSLGQFLISIAAADGQISPSEIKILSKIYSLIGLDPDSVYSDVHSLAVGESGLVTVLKADGKTEGYTIPKQPIESGDKERQPIHLDPERIAEIRKQSKEAAAILGSVFTEEEGEPESDTVEEAVSNNAVVSGLLLGLDAKHSAFVRILAEHHHWTRSDFELLAQRHDLLPGGALEAINEASFNVCGEALIEGDDPLDINKYAKEELLR